MLIAANNTRYAGFNRTFSGVTTIAGGERKEKFNLTGARFNWFAGAHNVSGVTSKSSVPNGARHPVAWLPPRVAGGLATHRFILGAGSLSGIGVPAKNAVATLAGTGTLSATGQLVVSLVASLLGSGTISNASAVAFLQLAATLAGSGNLTAARNALANAFAALSGTGTASGSTIRATGTLAANITSAGNVLDTSNVGPAVWAAVAALNNVPGSMGEKLNDAGSGSNPWTEVLESGYTAAEILRILAAYAAGDVTGGPASPSFKSLDGSKTRIGGTADADGNRTRTTLDGS